MSNTTTEKPKMTTKQRQQRKLIITGALLVSLIILLALVAFVSCGAKYSDVNTNTIFVLKNGKVITTDVEAFDEKTYSSSDVQTFIKNTIDTYNNKSGKGTVSQKSFNVKDNVAKLVLEYENVDTYKDFIGTELFAGSIADAKKAGYKFDVDFAAVKDGVKACEKEAFMTNKDLKVVIVRANTAVVVEGEIMYVSAKNISAYTEDSVTIKPGCSIFDLAPQPETETTTTESAEGADGVVNEDEFVVETEEEIIFDFGEEVGSDRFTKVYTYIIYK